MGDPERLDLDHGLPDDLRDAMRDDTQTVGTIYNDLQDTAEATFADRFGDSLATLQDVARGEEGFVVAVLGLAVAEEHALAEGDLVAGAELVSVHRPNDDGSVSELLYVADGADALDYFVLLPLRLDDCPPGSGNHVTDLGVGGFREVVAAMVYKRFDLLQNDVDSYASAYLRPLVRGLEAYAAENDLG